MINYNNSIIYKIVDKNNTNIFYVGSTTKTLRQRFSKHKRNSKEILNRKFYEYVKDNGGWDNFYAELVETYSCNDKVTLLEREKYYYKLLCPQLNARLPIRNKEEINECNRQYYKNNKERILFLRSMKKLNNQTL